MASCITNRDFEYTADGKKVFTKEFLLRRGYCCKCGCTNCPYDEIAEVDPNTPQELIDNWSAETNSENDTPNFYAGDIPEDQEL